MGCSTCIHTYTCRWWQPAGLGMLLETLCKQISQCGSKKHLLLQNITISALCSPADTQSTDELRFGEKQRCSQNTELVQESIFCSVCSCWVTQATPGGTMQMLHHLCALCREYQKAKLSLPLLGLCSRTFPPCILRILKPSPPERAKNKATAVCSNVGTHPGPLPEKDLSYFSQTPTTAGSFSVLSPFFFFFPTCTSGDVSFKFRSALDMLCFTPEKQLCLKTLLLIIFKCPYRCPSQEANAEEVGTHIIPEHPGGNAELSVALLGSASLPAPLFLMTAQHALPKHSSAVNKQNEAMFSKTHAVSQTLQCRIQQIPFNVMCIYPYITYVNGFDVRDARSWKIYLFFYIWEREFSQAIALGWICCFKISFQPHTCKDNYCELKAKHAELIPKTCRWLCKYCCKGLLPRNVE